MAEQVTPDEIEHLERATKAFTAFSAGVERATAALRDLEGARHGGITIRVVGEIAEITIAPDNPPVPEPRRVR